ncbi:hypothetical protein J2Y58_004116 [Sphingomonas sp. BE138]|uniref:hypothetical protein n=1 Tax=Sphingomonas sp. BE138 TaxID=2817845 RepID=UPI00286798FA|nr:hypothetical protein [Sphingomonas sp. BE138]MDR6790733.1 hypothetical protein [Sphingomonas sp. BE138]
MIALPPDVTFTKHAAQPGCWIYDFRHIRLGPLGRVVLTVLPDGAHTHVSCELAENPDLELTAERREAFEPLGREIAHHLEQAFAHRADVPPQSGTAFSPSST